MIEKMEDVLGRKLTAVEQRHMEWLLNWGNETVGVFNGLFDAFYKVGQEDANAYREALESGDARD